MYQRCQHCGDYLAPAELDYCGPCRSRWAIRAVSAWVGFCSVVVAVLLTT